MMENENLNETTMTDDHKAVKHYHVWDRTVRVFHWINVLCVTALIGIGMVILNSKSLDISNEGKILLKTIHVYVGYVLVLNLSWRFTWCFFGNRYSRWVSILPFSKDYFTSLRSYIQGLKNNKAPDYLGHNPIGRLMVALLFFLLASQAITGLILAGTDLYMPPFGHEISKWVGEDQDKLALIKPYSTENINAERYKNMRDFRKPIITLHYYIFYVILLSIVFHIAGVVISELRERSGLISAMITGRKVFKNKPVDYEED
ncbi:MAG: Ni/Fe-hydrogenase 1 B-type cytochrome subunit [Gammaproteobacteria bacterium]|jgi:Ni/Fe-hydrogenase 1 B-type cytochrome subunit